MLQARAAVHPHLIEVMDMGCSQDQLPLIIQKIRAYTNKKNSR